MHTVVKDGDVMLGRRDGQWQRVVMLGSYQKAVTADNPTPGREFSVETVTDGEQFSAGYRQLRPVDQAEGLHGWCYVWHGCAVCGRGEPSNAR